MAVPIELGRRGELLALSCLRKAGYQVMATNYRTRFGELDVVARHEKCLVFIEVKTRSGKAHGLPEEAVCPAKQKQLVRLARLFRVERELQRWPCRFDVVSVLVDAHGDSEVRIIQDAFSIGE